MTEPHASHPAPPPAVTPTPAAATPDAAALLTFGAAGAFAMALVSLVAFVPARVGGEALHLGVAAVGLASIVGVGLGFLGTARRLDLAVAKTAAQFLFLAAGLSLLPVLAAAARSALLLAIASYALPVVGAVAWGLAGRALLQARPRLDGVAAVVGWTLVGCAFAELVASTLALGSARGRDAVEAVKTLTYVLTAARLFALVGLGLLFAKLRARA